MNKTFYITTPIYYANSLPHLGHLYTTIIADVIARHKRQRGFDTYFLTGTDEHGLKIQQAADANGVTPKQFVDSIAPQFERAWERLDIKYDDFIRTTEPRHAVGVRKLLQACYDAGDIEIDTYRGQYCIGCEAYYVDDELVDGKCPIHRTLTTYVEEENYFFRLSRFEDRLLKWYADHPDCITPGNRLNEVLGFIKSGLNDFSVSRKTLKWGIPLPWDPSHVAYVWFDALANYITAIGYGTDDAAFAANWPVDFHFIGKEIIRFHCVYWPAMLMSAGIEPPKGWAVGGWLIFGGEKMSKSAGNVIDPLELVDEYGVECLRYYVLAEIGYGSDGNFTYEGMVGRYNSDLANNLGNLTARIATVVETKCGGRGTAPSPDSVLASAAATAVADTGRAWSNVQSSRALEATWGLIKAANSYLEQNEPWKMEPGAAVDQVMGDALEALRIVAILANPALPTTTQEIWRRIGLSGEISDSRIESDTVWGQYPAGKVVEKGQPLSPRKTV